MKIPWFNHENYLKIDAYVHREPQKNQILCCTRASAGKG